MNYAHSVPDSPQHMWQKLDDHLQAVAERAERFAEPFGGGEWARLLGLWHDLGKYKPAFQNYLRTVTGREDAEVPEGSPGRVDHSTAGAIHASRALGEAGRLLAYAIAGHHAGLPDWTHTIGGGGALGPRLGKVEHLEEALTGLPSESILDQPFPTAPPCRGVVDEEHAEHLHLCVRMLFSCLVDADFLDTEAFMDDSKATERESSYASLSDLKGQLDLYMAELCRKAAEPPVTSVNKVRRQVLDQCRLGAVLEPGLFSLTVPTGGGKTLASMTFALDHAIAHGKRRVIVVIPFTSIIEQTAEQFRKVFGEHAVIEHHSNLDPDKETLRSKLASENWDAPIIVTTNVQFFESLFGARSSACRKLHSIVDSVVVLDEAHVLPPEFLSPIVSSLKGLTELFGVSALLCTATQPALVGCIGGGSAVLQGFRREDVRELMHEPEALGKSLERVRVVLHSADMEGTDWNAIAEEVAAHPQVLCIVNTRRDCRTLFELLPSGAVHLSAGMCGEHRSQVIRRIKEDLKSEKPIRVVSTQLVEAGVDIDFPMVYRALAGLDSISQAAGRCNREGRLNDHGELGRTVVFAPPSAAPPGLLRKGQDVTRELIRTQVDLVLTPTPNAFRTYFDLFYRSVRSFDLKSIMELLAGPDLSDLKIQFRSAARHFRLIDDSGTQAIIVWFSTVPEESTRPVSSRELVRTLEHAGPSRGLMRKLQRFSVNVPMRAFQSLASEGMIRQVDGMDGVWVQEVTGLYDHVTGIRLEGPEFQSFV